MKKLSMPFLHSFLLLSSEGILMKKRKKQILETNKKDNSKKYYDPPVHEDETLRSDVERKREEIKNSTIGGF